MALSSFGVEQTLRDLERRMARLEAYLGMPEQADATPAAPREPAPAEAQLTSAQTLDVEQLVERREAKRDVREARRTAATPPPLPIPMAMPTFAQEVNRPATPVVTAPLPVVPPYEPRRQRAAKPVEQHELEQTIGLKWAGWVGAVVVVLGAAFGIKYAYDQRWFEVLPPAGRLMLMSLGGFALIAAGEWVYRRVHRLASACLYGAGVATLFLVSYAGFHYYGLYGRDAAFVFMALTTAIGAAVATRGNMVSIAVLAQIGGNLAPILLHSGRPAAVPFMTYLLTLQVVALTLAWWGRGGKWWTLRVMSVVTTSLWMLPILLSPKAFSVDPAGSPLAFCLLYALLFQVEMLVSTIRGASRDVAITSDGTSLLHSPLDQSLKLYNAPVFSLLVTALLTGAILLCLRGYGEVTRGAWVLGLAGVAAAAGFVLPGGREHSSRRLYDLALGYRVQAAALVVVAVPVALSGIWIIAGWGALALTFSILGNLLKLRLSRWAGVMVWRLAAMYLGWWTFAPIHMGHHEEARQIWYSLWGGDLRAYTIVAWLLALAGHGVAWITHQEGLQPVEGPERKFQRLAWVTNILATIVWITASVAGLPPAGATLAILVHCWLLLSMDVVNPRRGMVYLSAAVLTVALVKWVAVDTLADRLSPTWSPTARRPVFNAVMGVGVLISLTMGALYALRRGALWGALSRLRRDSGDPAAQSAAGPALLLAALLMTVVSVGLTFEIDRVIEAAGAAATVWPVWQLKQMAWTVLWVVCVCGFLGMARGLEPDDDLRPAWVGLAKAIVVALAVKFLVVDTLFFRVLAGARPAPVVVNFQTFTAFVVVASMILLAWMSGRSRFAEDGEDGSPARRHSNPLAVTAGFLAILVVLWGGTLEIDRAFERMAATGTTLFRDPGRAKQVAFSIFWSVFAVCSVVAGFRFRRKGLRYFGLALFAVTLLKVVLLDMSQVQTGYRVLSFMGLGLLLMGTSVLYGRLSPLLLREKGSSPEDHGSAAGVPVAQQ